MRKIAFYKLNTEGKIIKNFKTKDLMFFLISFLILFIPISIIFLSFNIDFSTLEKQGINVNIIIGAIIVASDTFISYFLSRPDKHTDESIIKSLIYPKIKYSLNTNVFHNYNEQEKIKKNNIVKIYIKEIFKYFKIEIMFITLILIILTSFMCYRLFNNYNEYQKILPSALELNLNYEKDNILVKKKTIENMKKEISNKDKKLDDQIKLLDSFILENKIEVDKKDFDNKLEESNYKKNAVDKFLDEKIETNINEIEKLRINNYKEEIEKKSISLKEYEKSKEEFEKLETPNIKQKKDFNDQLNKTIGELNDLLKKVNKKSNKKSKEKDVHKIN